MALSQRPQQLQELLRPGDFDVEPKEDVLQLSKLFEAPTKLRELQVTCKFLISGCLPSRQLNFWFLTKSCSLTPWCLCTCLSLSLEFPPLPSVAAWKISLHILQVSAAWPLLQKAISIHPSSVFCTCGIYHSLLQSPIYVAESPQTCDLIEGSEKLCPYLCLVLTQRLPERSSRSVC